MDTENRGARRGRRDPQLQENADFWTSVLSSVTSSLITAWIIFVAGTTIALAAMGKPGEDLKLPTAFAFVFFALCLSATAYGCVRYVGTMVHGWPLPAPGGLLWHGFLGVMAVVGLGGLNASSWVIGPLFFVVMASSLALIPFAVPPRLLTHRAHRAFHVLTLTFGLVGFTTIAVGIGAIVARALSKLF